ncbi:hypothetical protein [Corynebacterium bovis]|nr:hypothetical protein [Corynebacterium bovis]
MTPDVSAVASILVTAVTSLSSFVLVPLMIVADVLTGVFGPVARMF